MTSAPAARSVARRRAAARRAAARRSAGRHVVRPSRCRAPPRTTPTPATTPRAGRRHASHRAPSGRARAACACRIAAVSPRPSPQLVGRVDPAAEPDAGRDHHDVRRGSARHLFGRPQQLGVVGAAARSIAGAETTAAPRRSSARPAPRGGARPSRPTVKPASGRHLGRHAASPSSHVDHAVADPDRVDPQADVGVVEAAPVRRSKTCLYIGEATVGMSPRLPTMPRAST